jgi:hypothetical protein
MVRLSRAMRDEIAQAAAENHTTVAETFLIIATDWLLRRRAAGGSP